MHAIAQAADQRPAVRSEGPEAGGGDIGQRPSPGSSRELGWAGCGPRAAPAPASSFFWAAGFWVLRWRWPATPAPLPLPPFPVGHRHQRLAEPKLLTGNIGSLCEQQPLKALRAPSGPISQYSLLNTKYYIMLLGLGSRVSLVHRPWPQLQVGGLVTGGGDW
jgi:hypothetical protein